MNTAAISEWDLIRSAAAADFEIFCRLMESDRQILREIFVNQGQQIAAKLELLSSGKIKKLMINVPPRYGKTYLVTHLFSLFFLGQNPAVDSILCTHTANYSKKLAGRIRDAAETKLFGEIFGVGVRKDLRARGEWSLSKGEENGGQLFAAGVGGAIVGRGISGLGIIDDPIAKKKDAASPAFLENQYEWYRTEFESRLDSSDVRVLIIMQRWSENDLCGRLLDEEADEWDVLKIPAIIDEGGPNERSSWPERFPLERQKKRKSRMPLRWWNALYRQEPETSEEMPFRVMKFVKKAPPGRVYAYFDPAWGGEDSSCFVAGVKYGKVYTILFAACFQDGLERTKKRLIDTIATLRESVGLFKMTIELNSKGQTYHDIAKEKFGGIIQGVENSVNKIARIEKNLIRNWTDIYFVEGSCDQRYVEHLTKFVLPEDWSEKVPNADAADATGGLIATFGANSHNAELDGF